MRHRYPFTLSLLALALALTVVAAGCGVAAPLRVTVYGIAPPDQPEALDAARRWLGSSDEPTPADAGMTAISVFIENADDEPHVVSEAHAHPMMGVQGGRFYAATLRTAASPGTVLPPGTGIRAVVLTTLSPGAVPAQLAFQWSTFPSVVPLLAQSATQTPRASVRPSVPVQQLGQSLALGGTGVTLAAFIDEWPDVLVGVDNGSTTRFQIFADHMLHAVVLGGDGAVRPLAPADVTPLTVDVAPSRAARYRFRAVGGRPPGESYLIVTLYHDLKWESDVQGMAVYALPSAEGE